eukprot:1194654-Prorocentrum_minimum.AAC.1
MIRAGDITGRAYVVIRLTNMREWLRKGNSDVAETSASRRPADWASASRYGRSAGADAADVDATPPSSGALPFVASSSRAGLEAAIAGRRMSVEALSEDGGRESLDTEDNVGSLAERVGAGGAGMRHLLRTHSQQRLLALSRASSDSPTDNPVDAAIALALQVSEASYESVSES